VVFALFACLGCSRSADAPAAPESCLFCFWNVENLFDNQDDRRGKSDEVYDNWFAHEPELLQKKLHHLAAALLKLNAGRGPDILALAEVESPLAADLLRRELNRLLPDESLHYPYALMKEVKVGRHIAPALITRLPVRAERTRQYGRQLRILETHLHLHGQPLVVVASHWTSRVSDKTGEDRARYADQIYGAFHAMYQANPQVDWLMAGDCNDPPNADSITRHLNATGDRDLVRQPASMPSLLNLFADKPARSHGTHYFRGWHIYDSIFISPGLLDTDGWSCDVESAYAVNGLYRPGDRIRKPWAFGSPKYRGERGTSDHFPVTTWLQVKP
jgi:endonuclease/exonuclease/phosphatase family metal-dependent hydrolase